MLEFIGQPFNKDRHLGRALSNVLGKPDRNHFWAAVAWGKASGLSRLFDVLKQFRARGGHSEIVLGIDEGGATWEGLQLTIELFNEAFVFHDPGARTFHPKFYVAEGRNAATVFVGSGNLTRGGFFTNYEAALAAELDLTEPADRGLLDEVRQYYHALRNAGQACQRLDLDLLDRMRADPTLRITFETAQNRVRRASAPHSPGQSIFGASLTGLATAPAGRLIIPQEEYDEDASSPPAASAAAQAKHVSGFWKTLSRFDTSTTSAPGQMIIPIQFLEFFGVMRVQIDERDKGGVRQSDTELDVTFRDGKFTRTVDARAILYEPAAHHPRPNRELRFTFRDRDVLNRLGASDVLVFTRRGDQVVVERRQPGSMGSGKFAAL